MKKFTGILLGVLFSSAVFASDDETLLLKSTLYKTTIYGDVAVYNLSNAKLHKKDCEWAEKCVKNCITVDRKELKNMFYIPCAVCGGETLEPVAFGEE